MKRREKLYKIFNIIGIVAILIGSFDPLEGSFLILPGTFLLTFSAFLIRDAQRKLFLMFSILILFGVFFMFYFSYLGGFGGRSELSWWWGLLILPYPLAWIAIIILLISRTIKQRVKNSSTKQI